MKTVYMVWRGLDETWIVNCESWISFNTKRIRVYWQQNAAQNQLETTSKTREKPKAIIFGADMQWPAGDNGVTAAKEAKWHLLPSRQQKKAEEFSNTLSNIHNAFKEKELLIHAAKNQLKEMFQDPPRVM